MLQVCPKCHHLMTDNPHVCPSEEYLQAKQTLISAACEIEELYNYNVEFLLNHRSNV